MLPTALIPVRIDRTAKKRLAHVLDPDERMELMQQLFDHVATVLSAAGLETVALTSESRTGLNGVVSEALASCGAPALIVHADLPCLAVSDVEHLLDEPGDVVIARSTDGGTNGLLLRSLISPAFGVSSAHAHASRARRAGLVARVVDIPGFARDIDDPASLTSYGASFLPRHL